MAIKWGLKSKCGHPIHFILSPHKINCEVQGRPEPDAAAAAHLPGPEVMQLQAAGAQRTGCHHLTRLWDMQEGNEGYEADRPVPMLPVEDMLPGLAAGVPAIITAYSGGASCDGSDAAAKRSAKVKTILKGSRPDLDVRKRFKVSRTHRFVVRPFGQRGNAVLRAQMSHAVLPQKADKAGFGAALVILSKDVGMSRASCRKLCMPKKIVWDQHATISGTCGCA